MTILTKTGVQIWLDGIPVDKAEVQTWFSEIEAILPTPIAYSGVEVFRPYIMDGLPAAGPVDVDMLEMGRLGAAIEASIGNLFTARGNGLAKSAALIWLTASPIKSEIRRWFKDVEDALVFGIKIVASRGDIGRDLNTVFSAGQTRIETRVRATIGGAAPTELWVAYGNYVISTLGVELFVGNAITIESAIEIDDISSPDRRVARALFVGTDRSIVGTSTGVMGAGAPLVLCGPVTPADFGLAAFEPGQTLWIRTGFTLPIGANYPAGEYLTDPGEGSFFRDSGASASQVFSTGAMTGTAGDESFRGLTPLAILGRTATDERSVIGLGDSNIMVNGNYGNGKDYSGDGGRSGGWFRRGLKDVSGRTVPWAMQGRNTAMASNILVATRLRELWQYADTMVIHLGTNDIVQLRGSTQTIADIRSIIQVARQSGVRTIIFSQIPPFSTSSDYFVSLAGQTVLAPYFAFGGERDIVNSTFFSDADPSASEGVNFYLQPPNWEDVTTRKWSPNGTIDGVHANVSANQSYGDTVHDLALLLGGAGDTTPRWIRTAALLDIDFVEGRCYPANKISDVVTTARAIEMSYAEDSRGYQIRFPAGQLRRTDLGVLNEAAAVNLLGGTRSFASTYWTKHAINVGTGIINSPEGAVSADKIANTATNDFHYFEQIATFFAGVIDAEYNFSAYFKAGELTWVALEFQSTKFAYFNLSGGGSVGSSAGCTATIELIGTDFAWYRCSIRVTGNFFSALCRIYLANGNGGALFTGANESDGVFVWGPQVTQGAERFSYQANDAAGGGVVRGADNVLVGGLPLSGLGSGLNVVDTQVVHGLTYTKRITLFGTNLFADASDALALTDIGALSSSTLTAAASDSLALTDVGGAPSNALKFNFAINSIYIPSVLAH